jgi:Asp-tRNA(Asn)/Glu-tRNA(Gln) amidotransferase B subunit
MIRANVMSWRRMIPTRRFFSSEWTVHPETGIVSHVNQPLFQTIIGMEIHAQLDIPTKLFSSAPRVDISSSPNQAVWPLDVAVPGTLPRLSLEAVQAAILTAAACGCEISQVSRFERKHYAYADLPLGYQVTQQRWPIAKKGLLTCRRKVDPKMKQKKQKQPFVTVGIDRIQLEQDTGKTIAVTKREVSSEREFVFRVSILEHMWADACTVCRMNV